MEPVRVPATGDAVGPYRLLREIGAGATARVFEAEHQELGRRVAIKILAPRGDVARARSMREGRAAARIRHPHVVDVIDFGSSSLGLHLVMELVPGGTLASRVPKSSEADVENALVWLLPVVSAVAAAHAVGVVHRDLKPANILAAFDARGGIVPKVADFGISKLLGAEERSELTGGDGLLGTPQYMAPEQMLDPRTAGPAADQYSLGVLLYQFACGRLPYEAETTLLLMNQVVAGQLTPLDARDPRVNAGLARVVERALAVSPEARFPSVRALGQALLPFASERTRALHAADLEGEALQPPPFRKPRGGAPSSDETFDDGDATGAAEAVSVTRDEARARPAPARRAWHRWAMGAGAAAVIAVGVGLFVSRAAGPADTIGLGRFSANATPATSSVDAAAQAYRLGMKAMRDSAWEVGLEQFRRASELDPELGVAHLRLAMAIASPEPDARVALTRARTLRDQLSARDRVFLSATEALYFESPPDHAAHIAILRAGVERFPDDAELVMHLAMGRMSPEGWTDAEALARRALVLEPDYPDALQTIARAHAARGEIDDALAGLARCIEISPLAIGCRRAEAAILGASGRCEKLGVRLRAWTTLDPKAFEPQLMLAGLLARDGEPYQAIEELQRQRWEQSNAENRPSREKKDRIRTALYRRDFDAASALLDELAETLEAAPDPESDDWWVAHRLFASERRGDLVRGRRAAEEYLARAAARVAPDEVAGNARVLAIAFLARHGAIDSARRDELASRAVRWPDAGSPRRAALERELDVALATTPDEARRALAAFDAAGLPMPEELATAHARAVSLAAPDDAAALTRALAPATRGCDGLTLASLEARATEP